MEWGDSRIREVVWANIHPEPNTGCWLWSGYINHDGYGRGYPIASGRLVMAHRITFEALVAPLETGMELDHLCRTRACCNPLHLEAVTHAENILRGQSFAAVNGRKTECKRGHEYTEGSFYTTSQGGRQCKECHKIQQAHFMAKQGKGGYKEYQNVA